jgi:hypothetical protein
MERMVVIGSTGSKTSGREERVEVVKVLEQLEVILRKTVSEDKLQGYAITKLINIRKWLQESPIFILVSLKHTGISIIHLILKIDLILHRYTYHTIKWKLVSLLK